MKITFFALCLLFLTKTIAQNKIEGQIVSEYGKILPFSNIKINNSPIGTFSNSEGVFVLKFDNTYLNDTLVISHLGYNDYTNSIKNIIDDNTVSFKLEVSLTELDEVVIENVNAKNVALEAFSKLTVNHIKQDYDVFFRRYGSNNGVWKQFIEASLYIKDLGLSFEKQNAEIYINEIRKSKDLFKESNTKTTPYGDLKDLLFFNPKKCNYTFLETIKKNGLSIYHISFTSKKRGFEGNLYIDKRTLGFYKINYQGTKKYNNRFRKRENEIDGVKTKTYLTYGKWEFEMTFNINNDKFEFTSVKHNIIRNTYKRNNKNIPIYSHKVTSEMYFSKEHLTTDNKILLSPRKHIYNVELPYNKSFWDDYNAVVRDSIQKTVIKILEE